MHPYVRRVSLLLFGSGFCALVYQVAWLRLLRLIFGSSTGASAAVLAIFMGGLGVGSYLLGRRGDRSPSPLGLYGNLELGISIAAAASPLLVAAVRASYIALGGTYSLPGGAGLALRMLLAAVVLAVPTFLMGGTLPAAVRAITRDADARRHSVGLLYAINTLGAVVGAMATNFLLIELLGIQRTIWLAALLNLLVAVVARATARERGVLETATEGAATEAAPDPSSSAVGFRLVLTAAALVGFVFFLMELVWYRMLAPILGGSTYTFGVVLAVALLGIGAGGLIYAATTGTRRPTARTFALTCALEAVAVALPFALGDAIAFLSLELRGLQALGFSALVATWTVVCLVVVLPASLVAGYQFPLLVALLGSGKRRVARQVGLAYAWNTVGAIGGAIAGGFGLIPLLSAPGAWRLSVGLLALLSFLFLFRQRVGWRAAPIVLLAVVAIGLGLTRGPSNFWRHSGIGAGRLQVSPDDPNEVRDLLHTNQRKVRWQKDGRESSVAMVEGSGYAFYVNGKSDGSARGDAPTQVMSGLVGTLLHPKPTQTLVVGLGTGSTAGWMAQVEGVERVDVVELEPVIRRVAEDCAPVNRNALSHDNVNLIYADAREYLQASDRDYDVIFSEPSNPYRAGVASLFTREFYRAASRSLTESGVFIQWLQAYEVDSQVVRTAYATLASVFPHVETWQVHVSDLLLLASNRELVHDLDRVERRVSREPYRTALSSVWGVSGLEGLYTGFVAPDGLARAIADTGLDPVNTDDRPVIEYGFARTVGRHGRFTVADLRQLAQRRGEEHPRSAGRRLDPARLEELREVREVMLGLPIQARTDAEPGRAARSRARAAWTRGALLEVWPAWSRQQEPPRERVDLAIVAESLAEAGDVRAPETIERLRALQPTEATAIAARWSLRTGDLEAATERLVEAFRLYRTDPWPQLPIMERALSLAREIGRSSPAAARRLFEALEQPFAVGLFNRSRLLGRVELARQADFSALCVASIAPYEPYVPWREGFLTVRRDCYEAAGHPLRAQAQSDLEDFHARGELPLWWGLLPEDAVEAPDLEIPRERPTDRSGAPER